MNVVQFGGIWSAFRERFPNIEQKSPYQMPIEMFGQPPARPSVSLELVESALPRLWFVDAAGSHLVQVQNDWFARNWRRVDGAEGYPRYPTLSDAFVDDLQSLQAYLHGEGFGEIVPTQCEVTYVDHIELPDGGEGALGSVLSSLTAPAQEFALRAEGQRLATNYIVEHGSRPVGRLHVNANTAIRRADGTSIAVLNFTARGVPIGGDIDGVIAFHDLGREWAWRAFTTLTRPEVQESWGVAT
jgi:uncharacterized protein (TIGR04255 family)